MPALKRCGVLQASIKKCVLMCSCSRGRFSEPFQKADIQILISVFVRTSGGPDKRKKNKKNWQTNRRESCQRKASFEEGQREREIILPCKQWP